ncbi:hypothetical protein CIB48_g5919 [Xylaria polymorpha]|nr:hypothetical protein CIB48_g5919 [Xylaria polymorpha]
MAYSIMEISVPHAEEGALIYTLMEVEATPNDSGGNYWTLGYRTDNQAQAQVPPTTSALPGTPVKTTSF